jgi:hypothetical protein
MRGPSLATGAAALIGRRMAIFSFCCCTQNEMPSGKQSPWRLPITTHHANHHEVWAWNDEVHVRRLCYTEATQDWYKTLTSQRCRVGIRGKLICFADFPPQMAVSCASMPVPRTWRAFALQHPRRRIVQSRARDPAARSRDEHRRMLTADEQGQWPAPDRLGPRR